MVIHQDRADGVHEVSDMTWDIQLDRAHVSNETFAVLELDSIPTHPLGVKPLGNSYIWDGPIARQCIGPFELLPDEVLMVMLESFEGSVLQSLGATCRFLYAFCWSDELWKALFLRSGTRKPERWRRTWRRTLVGLDKEAVVDCSNVFSDVLHRPFACSEVNLFALTCNIPKRNEIHRFENLSYSEFAESWATKPFIMTDAVRQWPVCRDWTMDSLLKQYANVEFRAEAVDWPLSTYVDYMANNSDESPLYLFDKRFAEKMGLTIGSEPGSAYWRPDTFGPDLFEVLGEERPAHRWLIIGPRGSGSTFHKDPNATSAWNAVVRGSKYWIMFPPDAAVPGVYVSADSSEVTSPLSIAEWMLTFHQEARRQPECIEGICREGEILHVPSGWWHLVVNLEAGIALTQNFVPKSPSLHHLAETLSFLRDRPEQVTGFGDGVADPYGLFVERMREQYPDLLDGALEVLQKRKRLKRTWDEAIKDEDDVMERRVGFSFGFVEDDSESE